MTETHCHPHSVNVCWLLLLPMWLRWPPGAPDLDHTNPHLREALVHWMQHLRDNVGYRGWRFDFAKVGWASGTLAVPLGGGGAVARWQQARLDGSTAGQAPAGQALVSLTRLVL